jgi:hypothetical protein
MTRNGDRTETSMSNCGTSNTETGGNRGSRIAAEIAQCTIVFPRGRSGSVQPMHPRNSRCFFSVTKAAPGGCRKSSSGGTASSPDFRNRSIESRARVSMIRRCRSSNCRMKPSLPVFITHRVICSTLLCRISNAISRSSDSTKRAIVAFHCAASDFPPVSTRT